MLRHHAVYGLIGVTLSLAAIFLSAWAIFWSVFPPYGLKYFVFDALLGRLLSSIVLGIAFGILFGILLNSLLLGPTDGTFSNKGKALVALLLVLLLLGVGGEQVIQDVGRRVSKLCFGGAEIAFNEPAKQPQPTRRSGDSPVNLLKSSTINSPSLPIDLFYYLPEFIQRDQLYIPHVYKTAILPPMLLSELTHAEMFARTIVAPIGRCLATIFNQTGDIGFVRDSFSKILPALRDVTLPEHSSDDFANKSTAEMLNLLRALFLYTYNRIYILKLKDQERYRALGEVRKIEESCLGVTYVLCSSDAWDRKQDALVHEEKNKDSIEKQLDDATLGRCHKRKPIGASLEADAALNGSTITQPQVNELFKELHDYLRSFADKEDFHKRPYLAIIIATILAQSGQDETALVYLEDWVKSNNEWTRKNTDYAIVSKWLQVRALTIMSTLAERWIGREGAGASLVLREFHINRLGQSLDLADSLFDVKTALSKLGHGTSVEKFESLAFSAKPRDLGDCPLLIFSKPDLQLTMLTWYLSAVIRITDHRLLSPRYVTHHLPDVNKAVRELLEVNLGCTVDLKYRNLFRAEMLRLYAQMQLQDAIAMKSVRSKPALASQLASGVSAVNLALYVIGDEAERGITERLTPANTPHSPMPILERLAPSEPITVYEQLLAVKARLQDAILAVLIRPTVSGLSP